MLAWKTRGSMSGSARKVSISSNTTVWSPAGCDATKPPVVTTPPNALPAAPTYRAPGDADPSGAEPTETAA